MNRMYGYCSYRRVYFDSLRQMCIDNGWYDCGDNRAYDRFLRHAYLDNITDDDIVEMATDVIEHSSELEIDDMIPVMNEISSICGVFFYEV